MSFTADKGDSVKNFAVNVSLSAQPPKAVSLRLDFIPMKQAIHHREVDPSATLTKPQLIDKNRIRIVLVFGDQPTVERRAERFLGEGPA